ncbi:recombinase family protein [Chloroflexota bacterium]
MFALEKLIVNNDASAITVLMFFIHSYQADEDGKIISHSMLGGRDKLATEAHEIPNGMVMWPFDYMSKRIYGKMSTGKPTINKERVTWVKKWNEWVLEEGIGLNEVCRRMNEASVPTPRATRRWKGAGKKWQPKAIRDILRSEQLIGIFRWKGNIYIEDGETVLTKETFYVLQKRLDENSEKRYYNAAKYDYPPLPKMVFHACGQLMYGIPVNCKPYYHCPKCRKSYISAQTIWDELQQGIKHQLLREERLIPAIRAQFDNKDTAGRLEQEIKAKAGEIQKWDDAKDTAFRMGMTLKNYPQERVQEEIARAEENIQRLQAGKVDLEKRLRTFREQKLNEEGIKRLCQSMAKNIDSFTKNQWEVLNKLLKLRVTVYSKELVTVNVALPPVRGTGDTQIGFSRLSSTSSSTPPPCQTWSSQL